MKYLKTGIIIVGLLAVTPAFAQNDDPAAGLYSSGEFVFDAFGSVSYGQSTINNITATRVRHDARLGAGVGMAYFIHRNVGIGADAYSESLSDSFVDNVSGSIIGRFPIGESGFAPYVFGGGGYLFDLGDSGYVHLGGGVEYRFTATVGMFFDGRYMFVDKASDVGLFRLGVRFGF